MLLGLRTPDELGDEEVEPGADAAPPPPVSVGPRRLSATAPVNEVRAPAPSATATAPGSAQEARAAAASKAVGEEGSPAPSAAPTPVVAPQPAAAPAAQNTDSSLERLTTGEINYLAKKLAAAGPDEEAKVLQQYGVASLAELSRDAFDTVKADLLRR